MSGHSKWSQIKRKKAVVDSKRGKVFSKLVKEISVAAKIGGVDPDMNPRLRTVINKAKEINMPVDNVKRAIAKATDSSASYEEFIYEGYGPSGAAILIEIMTDNKNRTAGDIRCIMSKNGGNLGETGCVSWMFEKKGLILVEKKGIDEDSLMNIILEAGALDMKNDPDNENYEIFTESNEIHSVKAAIEAAKIKVVSSEVSMIPQNQVTLDEKASTQILRLMDALDDNEDVQNVYSNFEIPDEIMERLS
ncbi:MAG: YebC/PmpR family DNA-binding transcriptional regulator [Nitrospirae bacterium]|nr:YebC/PmpR family DNA-binding transcriptional regulator [Nitrospirota bacterium]